MSRRIHKRTAILVGVLVVSIIVAGAMLWNYYDITDSGSKGSAGADVGTNANIPAASLAMTPSTVSTTIGNNFTINLSVNTGNIAMFGLRTYINYDSTKLQPTNTTSPAVKVPTFDGNMWKNYIFSPGKIRLEMLTEGANSTGFNGSANFATIEFKTLSTTSAPITLSYQAVGGTINDSYIADGAGDNILNTVSGSSVTINFIKFQGSVYNRETDTQRGAYSNPCPPVSGTLDVINPSTLAVIINDAPVTMAANCEISVTGGINLSAGTYHFEFDFMTLLKKRFSNIVFPPAASPIILSGKFVGGDFDGNDCVNISDWNYLKTKWDAVPGSANWDPAYSLKNFNYIGIADWGVMAGTLNVGNTPPGGLCPPDPTIP